MRLKIGVDKAFETMYAMNCSARNTKIIRKGVAKMNFRRNNIKLNNGMLHAFSVSFAALVT